MKRLAIIAAFAVVSPATAMAQDAYAALENAKCIDGKISTESAIDTLLSTAKVTLDRTLAEALLKGKLGTLARQKSADDKPEPIDLLFSITIDMLGSERIGGAPSPNRKVTVHPGTLPSNSVSTPAELFLNGELRDAQIRCYVPPSPLVSPTSPPLPPPPPKMFLDELVIGQSQGDINKPLKDRKFATVGLNSEDGDTSIFANIAFGLKPRPLFNEGDLYEVSWSPFIEYNRKTADDPAKEINNISIGAGLLYAVGPENWLTVFDTDALWQTDDKGDASVWKLQNIATIPSFEFCHLQDKSGWYSTCSLSIAADHAQVDDPGTNPKWAQMDSYTRAGTDLEWTIGRDLGPMSLSFGASYASRFDVSNGDSTAELLTAQATLSPSDSPHFSFSASYKNGKDLGTLTDVDIFALEFGYRQ